MTRTKPDPLLRFAYVIYVLMCLAALAVYSIGFIHH